MFDIQFLCATIFPKNLDVCSFLGYNIFVIDMFFEVFSSGTFYKRKGFFYNNIGLPAASTTVPSLSVPSLRGSVPPWRAQSSQAAPAIPPQPNQEPVVRSVINSELSRHPRHQDRGQEHPQQKQLQRSLHQGHRGEERLTSQIKSLAPKLVILRDRGRHRLVQLYKGTQGAVAPGTLQSLPDQLNPRSRSSLPYKAPPLRPPKPDRPAPSPPERPFKAHPIGIEKVRSPVGASSPGPPPLDADERARREADEVAAAAAEAPPRASGESSGSGLAPHVRGRPLPEPSPTFSAEGSAGHRPRHHGPELQPPRLVSKVVELETDNIRICVDWHDTETTNGRNFHFRHLTNL